MRKVLVIAILCLSVLTAASAVSINHTDETHPFDSVPMLDRYFDSSDDGNLEYWDGFQISLLTISQGGPLYSWFGHSAFLVETPDGRRIAFDYGTFSFSSEDFIRNFVMGRLWFLCLSTYADYRIDELAEDGRSATRVVLPLTAAQKKAIVHFMDANSSRENREYLYHHYRDNCATRLRDIIDRATDGDFGRWAMSQPGFSFRQQASRALSRNRFVQWGLEFLQSSMIDGKATLWDEMFLPEVLEAAVMRYYGLENSLVVDNSSSYRAVPDKPQNNILFSIILGLALGLVSLAFWYFGLEKARGIYGLAVDLVFGILGSVLLFMMLFTNHDVTWMNENILFVNPLLIVLGVLSLFRRPSMERLTVLCYRILLSVIAVLVVLKVVLPGTFMQQNWPVIITVSLFYIPNCLKARRK